MSEYSEDAHHDDCLGYKQSMETFLVITKQVTLVYFVAKLACGFIQVNMTTIEIAYWSQ